MTATHWKEAAAAIRWHVAPFIDGRYCPSHTSQQFDNINPATELPLCTVTAGDAHDVDTAVRVARRRFEQGCWSSLRPERRAEILAKLAGLIELNKSELALLDTLQMGKPIKDAIFDAEKFAPIVLRSSAGFADKLLGETAPLDCRLLSFNVYQPRGVIGAITAWNFPVVNAAIKIAPALAAGNSVVLKPSELTPSTALKLAELAIEAGIPEGVLNVVPGLGSTVGAALAAHPDVDLLSFTGSTATGRKLLELSGLSNGKPLLLECGGKSPHVVFSDMNDLEGVANAVLKSALWNQGQVCIARTRVIVHEDIKSSLLDRILAGATNFVPADPLLDSTTFGPLASAAQRDRVRRYVESGLENGAQAVLRGRISEGGGCYVAPTIFDRVDPSMPIVREEIFGPVLCVQTFQSEEEALALANGTRYGLAATVWTRDMARGRRLAHGIRVGSISIRSSCDDVPEAPFLLSHEPQRASGFGCEFGRHGLESYSTLKAVTFVGA